MLMAMLVGRDLGCAALERMLVVAKSGSSAAMVLSGQVGLGRSARLDFVADRIDDNALVT